MKKALLISCFEGWYKNRLEPIHRVLEHAGYCTKCLVSDFDHINKKYLEISDEKCEFIHVPKYEKNISINRIKSHLCFGKAVNSVLNEYKPDLIYLVLPPNNTSLYCNRYKKRHPNTKLILDIIDLWPESLPINRIKNTFPMNIWRNMREDAIHMADCIFTECALYQKTISEVDLLKTNTLHLFKEQDDEKRQYVRRFIDKGKKQGIIRFAFLGSMNNIIDIAGICQVIKLNIESGMTCELHAIGDGESRDEFEKAVAGVGCKAYFYGKIFDENEKIRILAPCDYAFNMMKKDVCVGLTIKSIDYLSYGIPLINNIKGDTWKIVEEEKVGINISGDSLIVSENFNHYYVLDVFEKFFSLDAFLQKVNNAMRKIGVVCDQNNDEERSYSGNGNVVIR